MGLSKRELCRLYSALGDINGFSLEMSSHYCIVLSSRSCLPIILAASFRHCVGAYPFSIAFLSEISSDSGGTLKLKAALYYCLGLHNLSKAGGIVMS
eukprot:1160609-Pelagomonas_calceolata.AAC.2